LLHTESTYTVACPPPMSSQTTLAQRSSGASDKRGLSYKRTCSTFACVRVVVGVWKRVRVGAWHARTRRTSARGMHDEQASMHRGGKHTCRGKPGPPCSVCLICLAAFLAVCIAPPHPHLPCRCAHARVLAGVTWTCTGGSTGVRLVIFVSGKARISV
jgi:hypothetical protein